MKVFGGIFFIVFLAAVVVWFSVVANKENKEQKERNNKYKDK